ncbi:MAG: hypothetical protein ACRD3C_12980 [Vicinamibacterales bacterium]
MSNETLTPTRGVAVKLDRTRYLRYSLAALKQLQIEGADKSLGQVLLLGLQKDDPTLTLEQVEDLVDLENLNTLFAPIKKATGGLIDLSKVFQGMVEDPQSPSPATGQEFGSAR